MNKEYKELQEKLKALKKSAKRLAQGEWIFAAISYKVCPDVSFYPLWRTEPDPDDDEDVDVDAATLSELDLELESEEEDADVVREREHRSRVRSSNSVW